MLPMIRSRLLDTRPRVWSLGSVPDSRAPFVLNEADHLSHHMGVFGGSGSGKSKFLELLGRRLIDDYRGFCYIDPHGDTAEDLLAYAARRAEQDGSDAICKRIHYLEPSFETVFGYDPFKPPSFDHIAPEYREAAYQSWLHTRAQQVAEVVQLKQGNPDFQGMPLLQRILTDVLIAVGTPVGADGRHLPLSDAFVLLDRHHRRHQEVLAAVLPYLPSEVRGDFQSLAAYKSERQYKDETGSTINRLRALFSPVVKAIFSAAAETIDFQKIVKGRGVVLVNLRKTDFFSAEQRNAIGLMLIHAIYSAAETLPKEDRTPFYLIVDEAKLFLSQDMVEALDQARKLLLSVVIAGQHLMQFRRGDVDMVPSILENCGTMVVFQQKNPESLAIWKQYFGYANMTFEELHTVMDRPDGEDAIEEEEHSHGDNWQASAGVGAAVNGSHSTNHTQSQQVTAQTGLSVSDGTAHADQAVHSQGRTANASAAVAVTESPVIVNGQVIGHVPVVSRSGSHGTADHDGLSRGATDTTNHSESRTASNSVAAGAADGTADSAGWARNVNLAESQGGSHTVTFETRYRPRTKEYWYPTGRLRHAAEDQFHFFASMQRKMPPRHAMVGRWGDATCFPVRISDVSDLYPDKKALAAAIQAMKRKIYATHPYYTTPQVSREDEERRLSAFLAAAGVPRGVVTPEEPGGDPTPKPAAYND